MSRESDVGREVIWYWPGWFRQSMLQPDSDDIPIDKRVRREGGNREYQAETNCSKRP